jgi:hypothetical protein
MLLSLNPWHSAGEAGAGVPVCLRRKGEAPGTAADKADVSRSSQYGNGLSEQ